MCNYDKSFYSYKYKSLAENFSLSKMCLQRNMILNDN